MRRVRGSMLAALSLAFLGCDDPEHDFERMLNQPRGDPYELSSLFPNGIVMQRPPEGTIRSMQLSAPPEVTLGRVNGEYAERIPVPMTPQIIELGRARFNLYCATCHGPSGNADTIVARVMATTKPRSLIAPPVLDYPPGRRYTVIREGFNMMPAYDTRLDVSERWAVVAYVDTLQQRARAGQPLPSDAGTSSSMGAGP